VIAVRLLRDGSVVREAAFRELPVRIGRGPECEFPLFDMSVSRVHARIETGEDGGVVVKDLGGRNGLHVGPHRVSSAPVAERLRCRLGRVELEIEPLSDEPTLEVRLRDLDIERRRSLPHQTAYVLFGLLGWLALEVAEPGFWSPWESSRWVKFLGSAIAAAVLLPLAGAVWLVALKGFGRKLRIADTLHAMSRLPWIFLAVFAVGYLSYYPLSSGAHATLELLLALAATVIVVLLLVTVRRIGPSGLFRTVWAVATVALFLGVAATWRLTRENAGQPSLDFRAQAPMLGWAGTAESLDGYLERVRASALDAEAAAEAVRVRQAEAR